MTRTNEIPHSTQERLRVIGGELQRADKRTRALAMEHPFAVVGGALLFGYVFGRMLRHV